MSESSLLVIGASARAACYSARRSGFLPQWIDQFGDVDLQEQFPGDRINADNYPKGIVEIASKLPGFPFIYTGALENHPQVLALLQQQRKLLGNPLDVCRAVRDPLKLAECYSAAGICHPRVIQAAEAGELSGDSWLEKPLLGSGGQGIAYYYAGTTTKKNTYLQQYIEGESQAAVYVGDGQEAMLLGVTRQLIGESFLNATAFSYCGSIGPLDLSHAEEKQWRDIGNALVADFGLRGLFCVDAINNGQDIFPLEVNPRYSASVEVLEMARDIPAIWLHCEACAGRLPAEPATARDTMMAKAYLFAGQRLQSPQLVSAIYSAEDDPPESADIPAPASIIEAGHPLMSIFISATSQEEALQALEERSAYYYEKFNSL